MVYNLTETMVKKRFKLIDHTADTGLVARGDSLAEAFASVAYGMFSIITEINRVRQTESRQMEVSDSDLESLLFEWLNRLLYYFDVEMLLFKKFDVEITGENRLAATCYGEKYDPARHRLKTGVKSATYHMLKVDRAKNEVRIIFDI